MQKEVGSVVDLSRMPATKKNLASVVNITWSKKTGSLSLMIMYDGSSWDGKDFGFLDFPEMPTGVEGVGPGVIKIIAEIFKVITGQPFRLVEDDEDMIRYCREDLHQELVAELSRIRRSEANLGGGECGGVG